MDDEKIKEKEIELLRSENVLGFEFKNIKIKVDSRKTSAKDGEAIKKKYYLLFTCIVVIGERRFTIVSLSLPFMVSVHGSQDKDLWAKAFWDMAFSDGLSEIPMRGRNEVPLSDLLTGLKNVFSCIINANTERKTNEPQAPSDRKLNDLDLAYIKSRLFNGQVPSHFDPMISWTKFFNEPLLHMSMGIKLEFSFWEWFFRIADMLQEKAGHEVRAKALWNLNLLEGFISKDEAYRRLSTCTQPTLLLRFSDNNLNSVSVVVRKANREIDHLAPFKNKEDINEKMSLPSCIIRCEELENVDFVYPAKAKKLIEDQIPQTRQPQTAITFKHGYRKCIIKMINEGGECEQRRSSAESSPVTASIYSPINSPIQEFQVPNFVPQHTFPTESYNNNKHNFGNSFYGGLDPLNNQELNECDTVMSEEMIEMIYQDLQKHEIFFENINVTFDGDMYME